MSTNRLPSNAHTDLLEGAVNAIFDRIQQEVQSNPSYECEELISQQSCSTFTNCQIKINSFSTRP